MGRRALHWCALLLRYSLALGSLGPTFASRISNSGTPTFERISGPTSRARGKETLAASLAQFFEIRPQAFSGRNFGQLSGGRATPPPPLCVLLVPCCALVFSEMLHAVRVWHFPLATRKKAERRNACPLPRFPIPWPLKQRFAAKGTEETGLLPRFPTPWCAAKGVEVTGHLPRFPTPWPSQQGIAAMGVEETGLL